MAVVDIEINLENLPDDFLENVLPRSNEHPNRWRDVAFEIFRIKLETLEKRLSRYGRIVIREDLLPYCGNVHELLVMPKIELLILVDTIISRGYRR